MSNNNKNIIMAVVLVVIVVVSAGLYFTKDKAVDTGIDSESELAPEVEKYVPTVFEYDDVVGGNEVVIPTPHENCMNHFEKIAAECIAYKEENPDKCDELEDPNLKIWCQAKVSQDNSYCENIDPEYEDAEDCYIDTAQTIEDCNAIDDMYHKDYEKAECIAFVTNDPTQCTGPDYDRIACEAEAGNNPELCEDSTEFLERWDCKIALLHDEPGFCEQYHKAFCDEFYPEGMEEE